MRSAISEATWGSVFGLTGARESCGQGLCGCCTVLMNGRAVSGCLYLASFVDGDDVATIEGFDASDRLTPVQETFMAAGAFQCGHCTSGFVVMATQLLDEHPEPTDQQIAHCLSGNFCTVSLRRSKVGAASASF